MTKWEYFAQWCDYDQLNKELSGFGDQGWELVAAQLNDREGRWYLIFKRPAHE